LWTGLYWLRRGKSGEVLWKTVITFYVAWSGGNCYLAEHGWARSQVSYYNGVRTVSGMLFILIFLNTISYCLMCWTNSFDCSGLEVKGCREISIVVNSNRFIFRLAAICCWMWRQHCRCSESLAYAAEQSNLPHAWEEPGGTFSKLIQRHFYRIKTRRSTGPCESMYICGSTVPVWSPKNKTVMRCMCSGYTQQRTHVTETRNVLVL